MNVSALRERLRSRTVVAALVVVVLAIVAVVVAVVATADPTIRTRDAFVTATPEKGRQVELDTTLYLPETTPAPAVLLSQGFGGDKRSLDAQARTLAQDGFVVQTYSARGFGESGGLIHFASPDYEINDAKILVGRLERMDEVAQKDGNAQIAAAGSSYGGGLSLLLAAADPRVQAVAADITWNNLEKAFFPNNGGSGPGPFKRLYLGQLFANGFGERSAGGLGSPTDGSREPDLKGSPTCGRFAADVCAAYQESAAEGAPSDALLTLMRQASPSTHIDRIEVPTLLTQGEQDSLFPLTEANANAQGIAANGTPVSVYWRPGGHDASSVGSSTATTEAASWFHKVFDGENLRGAQPFTYAEDDGVISANTGEVEQSILRADGYPGIDGTTQPTRPVTLTGRPQTVGSPAGQTPQSITSIPGLGGISGRFDRFLNVIPPSPGQTALFRSKPVGGDGFAIVGASTVRVQITSDDASDAVLFAGLRDVADDGSYTLPAQLVAPVRVTDLVPGQPKTVEIRLPSVVQKVLPGHRLVLSLATSDFAYDGPRDARSYTISLVGGSSTLTIPTLTGTEIGGGEPWAWLVVGVLACVIVGLAVGVVFFRRRRVLRPDPDLLDVPVSVRGLVKEYAGGYRAVDDISFRVEKGQVVGLLGPNGAGKTTALRVLVGLITATEGELHVFGQPVAPGAPVLSRLGAFIEGPGFLPHLTGRENLRLYWAATGRPEHEAEFATALDIAGLGGSIDRRVRTYSQGMRQRLGIAQAMLGLPELLVLDEPTNGLDPPQIAEMREVMKQYAETGRTVVVSSHLLAEVEQTCTHVVVMHKGRLVSAGSVDEISTTDGMALSVADPAEAARVLEAAGISAELVPSRRRLEDVFLELIGEES